MEHSQPIYRKNLSLIISFMVLITVSLLIAILLAYNFTKKYVENEFATDKVEVFERTIQPYTNFFQQSIPEISYYHGYLDSASADSYARRLIARYAFIEKVIFYDTEVSNWPISDGIKAGYFSVQPKAIYQIGPGVRKGSLVIFSSKNPNTLSLKTADEFNKMAIKLSKYVESADTTQAPSPDETFATFYGIDANKISYLNVPRKEELAMFKKLMLSKQPKSPVFEKDMFTFYLNPKRLRLVNTRPELYQQLKIVPLVFEPLSTEGEQLTTEIALPGAFSGYKLYFSSTPAFLKTEIYHRFLPIFGAILLIYAFLLLIAYLIYRNLFINQQLFKLQYDFINNLTHEFKTPLSVIKVAGNNIGSSSNLTLADRKRYATILDQEAEKLNILMNKLLSFTQLENKSITWKAERIVLADFCSAITHAFLLDKPSFILSIDIKGVTEIQSDPILLSSIFNNLMDNAYKYSPPDRQQLAIEIKKEGAHILFLFKDKGIGMTKANAKHIFKKFYRIENQYNQHGSVGLGLAFCKELVNFMKGDITVKSQPGKGSTFIVSIPYTH
jgi:two-component system phosphate regulon sensor histidine kinase PhoR